MRLFFANQTGKIGLSDSKIHYQDKFIQNNVDSVFHKQHPNLFLIAFSCFLCYCLYYKKKKQCTTFFTCPKDYCGQQYFRNLS